MKNWILTKLFYSKMMKKIRMRYYKGAYDQGRFDEWADNANK